MIALLPRRFAIDCAGGADESVAVKDKGAGGEGGIRTRVEAFGP